MPRLLTGQGSGRATSLVPSHRERGPVEPDRRLGRGQVKPMSTVASSAVVRLSDQPAPPTSLTDALARLDTLVSPLVGIVREVLCLLRDTDEVRRHMVAAKSTG